MGGVILIFILVLLVALLITPALRARFGRATPPAPESGEPPHEVVVHQLDDHRGKKTSPPDDAPKPQG